MTPAVLLVDDKPENLLALRAVLEPLQCRTVAVTSGDAALKALLQDDFAVVLLDVQMPELDGFETAELIKQRERTRSVPIIFVTAISKERQHVFRGYSAGAVDYLFKPYDPDVLRAKVRVFLELDAKSRAAAESEALLRATFASAPVGLARLDTGGRIQAVSGVLAELLGYEPGELRGRLLETLVAPPGEWAPALRAGRLPPGPTDAQLKTRDGAAVPCTLTFARAQPAGAQPAAVVVGVQDLRERIRAEQEREQLVREQAARSAAERLAEHHRKLQSITDATLGPHAFEDLVGELLRRTATALAVDTASIALDEPDGRSTVHRIVGSADDAAGWYSVVSSDAGSDRTPFGGRMTSSLTVPLAIEGETIGALHVGALTARRFSAAEEGLLRLAADRAALAIQRARLYEREHAIAEELQRSLLPVRLPEVAGVHLTGRYVAAESGTWVGGDWYDAVIGRDGRLLLVIGDVAGRGIAAAATMAQLRSALHAYAVDGHGPGAVLQRLNAFLLGLGGADIATVGLVAVDVGAGELCYASAGHPPGLLVRDDGEPVWLSGTVGPPIGAVDRPRYEETAVRFEPGATLVLYTDGVVERRSEPIDRGLERLLAAVTEAPVGADGLCEAILRNTLAGAATNDDVTLLAMHVVAERAPAPAADPHPFTGRRTGMSGRQLAAGGWPQPASRSARVELAGGVLAGGAARQIVDETLDGELSESELSDLRSVIAEIVNNAVVHGDAAHPDQLVVVHLAASAHTVRAEISCAGEPFELRTPSPSDEPGGFGLVIVDRLTSRWGLDFEQGTCVWLEIDRVPVTAELAPG